jgi:hypothetical protein
MIRFDSKKANALARYVDVARSTTGNQGFESGFKLEISIGPYRFYFPSYREMPQ